MADPMGGGSLTYRALSATLGFTLCLLMAPFQAAALLAVLMSEYERRRDSSA